MQTVAFRCTDELKAKIEELAEAENRSVSNWLINLIKEKANEQRK